MKQRLNFLKIYLSVDSYVKFKDNAKNLSQRTKSLMFTQVILKYCYTNSCNIISKRRKCQQNHKIKKIKNGIFDS